MYPLLGKVEQNLNDDWLFFMMYPLLGKVEQNLNDDWLFFMMYPLFQNESYEKWKASPDSFSTHGIQQSWTRHPSLHSLDQPAHCIDRRYTEWLCRLHRQLARLKYTSHAYSRNCQI
jgi:hypothetical protein